MADRLASVQQWDHANPPSADCDGDSNPCPWKRQPPEGERDPLDYLRGEAERHALTTGHMVAVTQTHITYFNGLAIIEGGSRG